MKTQLGTKAIPKVEQLAGSANRVLAQLLKAKPKPTFNLIIVDPPREGLEKGMAQQLAEFEADKIIYVSCDPAALARDTSRLAEQGFHLTNLRAFDLFPNTNHVESVAVFCSGNQFD